jgi:F-type H+-transporting ATPase subunit epsilon
MIAPTQLRLIVVTPETTLLDEPIRSVRFPLYDGQMGVLPGRLPAVGRLGIGEMKYEGEQGSRRYFIDGGFVQIKGGVVTLLTQSAMSVDAIDAGKAEADLEAAVALKPTDDAGFAARQHAMDSARNRLRLGRK